MRKKELLMRINVATERTDESIKASTNRDSLHSRGLASEGYLGGYRDALQDVVLLINGTIPNRRQLWRREDA